jgi:outer membrane protein insertion porin family
MFNKASPESIDSDKERLLNYYRSLGYFDARVDHRIDYDESGKWIYLTFVVSEGERYTIRNVELAGNQYYKTEEIMPLFKIRSNEPFNQGAKMHDERLIRDLYGERGFIFADIVGQVKYLPNNQLDVLYTVAEGDIYRASDVRVHIEGDGHTKRDVVLSRMGNVRPGKILSSVEIENGERILGASAIFNTNPNEGGPPRIEVLPPDELDPDKP